MISTDNGLQHHLQIKNGDVGKYVILPGDPFRTDLIASFLEEPECIAHNREHKTWSGYLLGERVSVTSTGMGCPSTAIAVEELIRCGADTFIRVGNAGAVRDFKEREVFDGVIVSAAVRDEGTTRQYVPIEYPAIANRFIVEALSKSAKEEGKSFLEGIAHCKDSFYGEVEPENVPLEYVLRQRWEVWKRSNVICSEMETSALFIVSSLRGVRAGAIMNWGDMESTIKIACRAVEHLIEEDRKSGKIPDRRQK